jgi:hypothetical protein
MISLLQTTAVRKDVTVYMGDRGAGIAQPQDFRLCPLGCQFYSSRKIREFDILEFAIDLPSGKKQRRHTCTGAVVRCEKERDQDLYRVWLHFLDMPKASRQHLRCMAKKGDYLCQNCAMF